MRLAVIVIGLALPASADTLTCTFTQECVDADGCAETTYETQYDYTPTTVSPTEFLARATREDVNGSAVGVMAKRDGFLRFTAGEFFESTEETLTVTPSGDARLAVLLPDVPMLLSYIGTCQEASS